MIAKRLREKKTFRKGKSIFFCPLELTQNFINTKKDKDISEDPLNHCVV